MNNGSVLTFFMFFDGVPNFRNPGTGSIHNLATLFVEYLHFYHTGSKGGQNDHIPCFNLTKIFFSFVCRNKTYFHFSESLIDGGIMDNFVGNPNFFLGKMLSSFIGHGHCPFYAPTKTKGFRQSDGDIAPLQSVIILAYFLNKLALVLGVHHFHDFRRVAKTSTVIVFRLL